MLTIRLQTQLFIDGLRLLKLVNQTDLDDAVRTAEQHGRVGEGHPGGLARRVDVAERPSEDMRVHRRGLQ